MTGTPFLKRIGTCSNNHLSFQPDTDLIPPSFHFSFLYTLFMACDANFRLKLKNRKLRDIDLSPGWGYYVPEKEYYAHLKDRIGDTEVTSCNTICPPLSNVRPCLLIQVNLCQSNLHAVDHANKRSTNYSASGVGAAKCARHTFVMPNGVGDLQRGEKSVFPHCNINSRTKLTLTL